MYTLGEGVAELGVPAVSPEHMLTIISADGKSSLMFFITLMKSESGHTYHSEFLLKRKVFTSCLSSHQSEPTLPGGFPH